MTLTCKTSHRIISTVLYLELLRKTKTAHLIVLTNYYVIGVEYVRRVVVTHVIIAV